MTIRDLTRRDFLKTTGAITAAAALGGLPTDLFASGPRMATFPEKRELILMTSRPPQLETPMHIFKELITPNDALFVRWHIANIPTYVDMREWRLKVGGNVERELLLSMDDLKGYEKISYTAVIQCAGNSRSFFEPRVAGGQWGHGAMGNVTWTGVRLKDIMQKAGIRAGSVDLAFNGLDSAPFPKVPDFVKSLPVDKALEDDIMVAFEMNGRPLTMLNGFPARLIVPGWYATYWVKSLSDITVTTKAFEEFWMKPAYRIPDNDCGCVSPGATPKKTVPINKMTTRSFVINPSDGTTLAKGKPIELMGIAFSGGHSIRDVIVSVNGGKTWGEARLGQDKGKYSWIQWFYPWRPEMTGSYTILCRATNAIGDSQAIEKLWNPAGYLLNNVEKITVTIS